MPAKLRNLSKTPRPPASALLLDDLLYAIGIRIDPQQYTGRAGFARFKAMLRQHLGN